MNPGQRFFISVLSILVLIAAPAAGQTLYDRAQLTGVCSGTTPALTAELDIVNELPAEWTGWVVDRTTIGVCEPVTRVYGPVDFPSGAQTYTIYDPSAAAGRAYRYVIRPVDAEGNGSYFSATGTFSPGYYQTAYATCGDAIAVRGHLTSMGMPIGVLGCDGQCWVSLTFVTGLPSELEQLVDTTAVVELHGTLADEFEGPYLANVTSWAVLGECGTVPTTTGSWSSLKATYR